MSATTVQCDARVKCSDAAEATMGRVPLPPSIFLEGCAWGLATYIGVQRVLEKIWGPDFGTKVLMQGDSSGSAIALMWALGMSSDEIEQVIRNLAGLGIAGTLALQASDFHDRALDEIFQKHPDAYLKVSGRLQMGVTEFPRKHVWVSQWSSNDELRATLHASMHLPIYCREASHINGKTTIDGNISVGARHLAHGDDTLVISAAAWTGFEHFADMRITGLLPHQYVFPPSCDSFHNFVELGEQFARDWVLSGCATATQKRRGFAFKYGGAASVPLVWALRAAEGAMPRRSRARL